MKPPRETDLDPPLRAYLEARGYTVRCEVLTCDLTAVRGDELVIVELKRHLSVDLLAQAAERQRAADAVYVALPKPSAREWNGRWKGIRHLLRRLELGLILVDFSRKQPTVEVPFDPAPAQRRKRPAVRRAILKEAAARSSDGNLAGSTRRKLMTAYRETALRIAELLLENGPMTPKQLRERGTGPRTLDILYRNVYGWFERVGRGSYALSAAGAAAVAEQEPHASGN